MVTKYYRYDPATVTLGHYSHLIPSPAISDRHHASVLADSRGRDMAWDMDMDSDNHY